MPYRKVCNDVQREGAKPSLDLASELFFYIPLHTFRYGIKLSCAEHAQHEHSPFHPSGDPTPSPEDIAVTHQLVAAGQHLDIELVDHLVIGNHCFVSLKERLRW
jgi:RadC-like JAB domain